MGGVIVKIIKGIFILVCIVVGSLIFDVAMLLIYELIGKLSYIFIGLFAIGILCIIGSIGISIFESIYRAIKNKK